MSLGPFIRVSQKNYLRLSEMKKAILADSMDRVVDLLLDYRFDAVAKACVVASSGRKR